jgi:hypothetical protein
MECYTIIEEGAVFSRAQRDPGRSMALDSVRQQILTEKQNLMRELRMAQLQHAKEVARLRERLTETFADYCSTVRLLPADIADSPLTLATLT